MFLKVSHQIAIVNIEIFTNRHAYHYVSLSTGKRTGTIASRELPTLPAGLIYRVQEKAWFSEDIMLEWIEDVLKPYVANVPPGIVPILFLDSFTVKPTPAPKRIDVA